MKEIKGFRLWQIVYPIGIYYVISSVAFLFAGMLLGTDNSTYMLRQTLCACVVIPFLYLMFYRNDKKMEEIVMGKAAGKHLLSGGRDLLLAAIGTAAFGIAWNNVIAMTPLMQVSGGYQESSAAFFSGGIVFEVIGSGLLIPIAEELLFRGIVFKRLRIWTGSQKAILISALLFGIIHVNLVQFLYAGFIGLFLAFLVEKTGKLSAAVVGHMAANLIAIFRAETDWLAFAYQPTLAGIGVTLLMFVVAAAIASFLISDLYQKE